MPWPRAWACAQRPKDPHVAWPCKAAGRGGAQFGTGVGAGRIETALARVPKEREIMLLPYNTDVLMPPSESISLVSGEVGGLHPFVWSRVSENYT